MRLRGELFFAGLLLAACQGPQPQLPYSATRVAGRVMARSQATAEKYADLIDQLTPRVRSLLPSSNDLPVDLRVVSDEERNTVKGATWRMGGGFKWIEIDSTTSSGVERFLVAHELTHFVLDETWDQLPAVMEEGLAEVVAMSVDPDSAPLRRGRHARDLGTALHTQSFESGGESRLVLTGIAVRLWDSGRIVTPPFGAFRTLPDLRAALRLGPVGFAGLDPGDSALLYAVGYLLAARIGIPGLHLLCERAAEEGLSTVPADWIFQAARLDPDDRQAWVIAVHGWWGEAEYARILAVE